MLKQLFVHVPGLICNRHNFSEDSPIHSH